MRLLLIEDDQILGGATAQALNRVGFQVDWVKTATDGLVAALTHDYDNILLDLGLPDFSGETFIRKLRAQRVQAPVLVLTARGHREDRIALLDLGADDYMVKPIDIGELGARLRAIKRRSAPNADQSEIQVLGPLELFQASRVARWNGQVVTLTSREFDVLEALMIRRPRVVSKAQLEEALYGWGDEVESNAIEVHVHFLRKKFVPGLIVTVRGKGYQMGSEDLLRAAGRSHTPPPT